MIEFYIKPKLEIIKEKTPVWLIYGKRVERVMRNLIKADNQNLDPLFPQMEFTKEIATWVRSKEAMDILREWYRMCHGDMRYTLVEDDPTVYNYPRIQWNWDVDLKQPTNELVVCYLSQRISPDVSKSWWDKLLRTRVRLTSRKKQV